MQEIEETRRIALGEMGLILPSVQKVQAQTQKVVWKRARLYPKQEAAIFDRRRISVIEASTKSGKTEGCIVWLMELAMSGKLGVNYWWVAPVSAQAAIAFSRMRDKVAESPILRDKTSTYAAQGGQKIIFPNGATVWFKSGDNADSLYGEDVYGAVIDEASRMKEDAWTAIQSTLTATRGPVRIIGNVKGKKNWFYLLARRAQNGDPEMAWHKMDAFDAVKAGVLAAEEIEAVRGRMPEHVFRELYMAEASDDEGNPFGIDHIRACVQPKTDGRPYVWGWDLAKRRDWTVGYALDRQGRWVDFHRFQKPWGETVKEIKRLTGKTPAFVDQTGVGDPIVEELQRTLGDSLQGYTFTSPKKQMLMEGLAVALSDRAVSYQAGPTQTELELFEYVYTKNGVSYSAPEGAHDDTVCSLALAVWALTHRTTSYNLEALAS
jgi:phage FluMu gp28-like protein